MRNLFGELRRPSRIAGVSRRPIAAYGLPPAVGFSVADHVKVVRHYTGETSVDALIANCNVPDGPSPAGFDYIEPNLPRLNPLVYLPADAIDEDFPAS